jgi:glycerate 2-kinase
MRGIDLEQFRFNELGILSAFSIVPGPCSLDDAIRNSSDWITNRTEALMKVIGNRNFCIKTLNT